MIQRSPDTAAGNAMFAEDAPLVTINCDMGEGYGKWKMVSRPSPSLWSPDFILKLVQRDRTKS
jgi:hypothetical protein